MKKQIFCILILALLLTLCSCRIAPKAEGTGDAPSTAAPAAQSLGLEFQSNGNGTCTLTGFGDFSGEELVIPAQSPAGDTVTAIAEGALALSEGNSYDACMSLETLVFDHVDLTLNSYAVCDLSSLTQIIVKDSTLTLEENAFECGSIETVQVKNSTMRIGEFALASDSLDGFIGKNSTLTFEDNAYSACNIQKLALTDCNTAIGEYAFFGCEQLAALTVQGGKLEIGESAFKDCTGLTEITLNCPVSVGKNAFGDCENLTGVQFGDDDVKLGDEAFAYCGQLKSVSVGDADVEFNTDVFYGCPEDLVINLGGRTFNSNCEEIGVSAGKVYTVKDLSITLPDDFEEYEVEGAECALASQTAGLVFFREAFSAFDGSDIDPDELSLTKYAQLIVKANDLDAEVEKKDGVPYFIYEKNGFTYYTCIYRGPDAFWRINLYTYADSFDEMRLQLEQWAASVTFD